MSRADVLVTVAELASALGLARPRGVPQLLDVRWQLGEPAEAGRQRYAAAHLPGARFLDLERVLTRHTGDPLDGRHPLPDLPTLEAGLGALGVDPDREIVVYDEAGSYAAGRAWWVLRWAGLRVRVLDGGVDAWTKAGMPTTADDSRPVPQTEIRLTLGHLPTVNSDGAAAVLVDGGVLLDVRAAERFRGEVEPIDPVAGHIPGAVNLPVSGLYAADGRLPTDAMLRERFGAVLDGRRVAVYCGSGVSATQAVYALCALGIEAALYPGSWSAWSSDPARPVATGGE